MISLSETVSPLTALLLGVLPALISALFKSWIEQRLKAKASRADELRLARKPASLLVACSFSFRICLKKICAIQLRTASAVHRHQLSELKKQVQALEREVAALRKHAEKLKTAAAIVQDVSEKHRFSAKGLRSLRSRLDLSADEFGRLIDVSAQSVYNWEAGKTVPRQSKISALVGLRGIGKRQARARLGKVKVGKYAGQQ